MTLTCKEFTEIPEPEDTQNASSNKEEEGANPSKWEQFKDSQTDVEETDGTAAASWSDFDDMFNNANPAAAVDTKTYEVRVGLRMRDTYRAGELYAGVGEG